MSNIILNKEDALFKHESLKFAQETNPFVYRCDQENLNGILLVTNIRMSFYYRNDLDELTFLHYLFNMINKIKFFPNSKTNIIEFNHAYEITTLVFRNKIDLIEFKNFISKNFPELLDISDIEKVSPLKNKVFTKDVKQETFEEEINNKVFSFDKNYLFNLFKSNLAVYIINLGAILLFIVIVLLFFPEFKNKIIDVYNYPSYWIGKQRCEKDMFIIAQKMNIKGEYPINITEFIIKNFKANAKDNIVRDPWGNLYDVEYSENNFKLISYGSDKKKGTVDDIIQVFAKINK